MSQENEDVDLLRQKALRGGNRAVVTKLVKEVLLTTRESVDDTPLADLNARLNSIEKILEEKFKYLKSLDEKILSSCSTAEIEREIEESSEWEIKINETLAKIKEFYKGSYSSPSQIANVLDTQGEIPSPTRVDLNASASPFRPSQQLSSPQNSALSRGNSEMSYQQGMKLPKITLQRFDGNVMKFQPFWQAFESAVHNNPTVSDVNKLNYLLSLLEGKAYRAVEGLDLRA